MSDIVFTVLECIICVLVILMMRVVLPYIRMRVTQLSDDELLKQVIYAVKSVEQDPMFQSQLGSVKKEEVLVRITAWANKHGIDITQEQLSQLIETAVYIMKYGDKNEHT